jgi:hypothetical protein
VEIAKYIVTYHLKKISFQSNFFCFHLVEVDAVRSNVIDLEMYPYRHQRPEQIHAMADPGQGEVPVVFTVNIAAILVTLCKATNKMWNKEVHLYFNFIKKKGGWPLRHEKL